MLHMKQLKATRTLTRPRILKESNFTATFFAVRGVKSAVTYRMLMWTWQADIRAIKHQFWRIEIIFKNRKLIDH